MTQKPKALIAWSSGKDGAWALHRVRTEGTFEVAGALTTISEGVDRVTMHGVRKELLRAQLEAAHLTAMIVRVPSPCPNDLYEARMSAAMQEAKDAGITHVLFGDLFLEDIRSYREAQLSKVGMKAAFPLWRLPTATLAREMVAEGLRAQLVSVDLARLPADFAGRAFDYDLLAALPPGVDPCGENGEFHTFACAGPMFERKIPFCVGETVQRDGFAYADLAAG
jgi:uncharacterized protein (TIGR00290 family)